MAGQKAQTTLAIAGEICPSVPVLLLLTLSIQKLQKHGTRQP